MMPFICMQRASHLSTRWMIRSIALLAQRFFSCVIHRFSTSVILLPHVDAFISPRSAPHSSVKGLGFEQRVAVTPIMSYADKLKEARAAKEAAARARSNPSSAMPSMASVPAVAIAESGSGAMGMNSKPLSDEILEAIRTAITILTARLQREKPLTRSEFERFESAVAVVVEDALPRQELPTQTMPSSPPPRATLMPPQVEPEGTTVDEVQNEGPEWDPKGGYGLPRGVRNSYVIDDMGKMTPEEYQAALRQVIGLHVYFRRPLW